MAVAYEQMWHMRNKIWKWAPTLDWRVFSQDVTKIFHRYWIAARLKFNIDSSVGNSQQHHQIWQPPLVGEYKFNFDAAFKDGQATTGVVFHNLSGCILGVWVNHFRVDNPYCAETEAILQALKIATHLNIDRAIFEGDARKVILALRDMKDFEDWRASHLLQEGRNLLFRNRFWFLSFIPRLCNMATHELAKWAKFSNFVGEVNLESLPPGCFNREFRDPS